jgi:hypothetical protein
MTTGVVRDGLVRLEGDPLPEGTRVRVVPEPEQEKEAKPQMSLREWVEMAGKGRAKRPKTSNSTDLLRELREERSNR